MRVNGRRITGMGGAMNGTLMETSTMESFREARLMGRVAMSGSIHAKYTMVSGLKELDMVTEYGRGCRRRMTQ